MGMLRALLIGIALVLAGKALERRGIAPTGSLLGMPYDFRPPPLERIRTAFWDPSNRSFLAPTPFGIGFAVNGWAVARRLRIV